MKLSLRSLDRAVEAASIVAHPVEVFLARAGIDHEQVVVVGHFVDDHVVDESSLGIEHGRVLRLSDVSFEASFMVMC